MWFQCWPWRICGWSYIRRSIGGLWDVLEIVFGSCGKLAIDRTGSVGDRSWVVLTIHTPRLSEWAHRAYKQPVWEKKKHLSTRDFSWTLRLDTWSRASLTHTLSDDRTHRLDRIDAHQFHFYVNGWFQSTPSLSEYEGRIMIKYPSFGFNLSMYTEFCTHTQTVGSADYRIRFSAALAPYKSCGHDETCHQDHKSQTEDIT